MKWSRSGWAEPALERLYPVMEGPACWQAGEQDDGLVGLAGWVREKIVYEFYNF